MSEEARRPLALRIGLVLLNIPIPGAGLLRTDRPRLGFPFIALMFATLALVLALFTALPELDFAGYSLIGGAYAAVVLGAILASFFLTWRHSRRPYQGGPIWTRWWAVAGIVVLLLVVIGFLADGIRGKYRTFYVAAESMEPTLLKGHRFIAHMGARPIARGDVVLVLADQSGATYVKRVAALAGDRIELRGGIVVLNGVPVPQRQVAGRGPEGARLLEERFPGEASPHRIADVGPSVADDYPEEKVHPGHIFVLGDNRDRSADSRVPKEMLGLEQIPLDHLQGKALFYWWMTGDRIGRPVH